MKEKYRTICIRLPLTKYEKIAELAEEGYRSVSKQIEMMIDASLGGFVALQDVQNSENGYIGKLIPDVRAKLGKKSSIQIGDRFGRLVVKSLAGRRTNRELSWICQCDCGNITRPKATSSFRRGNPDTKSCGCLKAEIASKNAKARNNKSV